MSTAERKRRYRERQSNGLVVLPIEVDEVALSLALVDAGLLAPDDGDNREQLARALERVISMLDRRPAGRGSPPRRPVDQK